MSCFCSFTNNLLNNLTALKNHHQVALEVVGEEEGAVVGMMSSVCRLDGGAVASMELSTIRAHIRVTRVTENILMKENVQNYTKYFFLVSDTPEYRRCGHSYLIVRHPHR